MPSPIIRAISAAQTVVNQPVAKPAGTVQDDLLVAVLLSDNTATPLTAPSGWVRSGNLSSSGGPHINVYTRVAGASEGTGYTWTFPVGNGTTTFSDSVYHV